MMAAIPAAVFEEFAHSIINSATLAEAAQSLLAAGQCIGMPMVTIAQDLDGYSPVRDRDGIVIEKSILGWPDELITPWYDEKYAYFHPDTIKCRNRFFPFLGQSDIDSIEGLSYSEISALNFTEKFGIRSQLMVPVHTVGGHTAFVSWIHSERGAARSVSVDCYGGLMCLANAFMMKVHESEDSGNCKRFELSKRQLECLDLLADGNSAKQIAYLLGISVYTVQDHIKSSVKKVRARSAVHAVSMTRRR